MFACLYRYIYAIQSRRKKMMKWMTDCILEAPLVCMNMLKNKDKITSKIVDLYTAKKYEKIVLVGSGSSYNIAMCAKYGLEKFLQLPVEVISPIAFANYEYRFKEKAFIICMSQSGRSTNTIEALNRARQCGYDAAGITMMPNSPLSHYCDHVLEYGSYTGEADSFVCRYFASSVLYFNLFAIEAANKLGYCSKEEYRERLKDLQHVVEAMPGVLQKIECFYETNKKAFYSMKRAMIMGIGPMFGLTNEGCLKFSETTGIPTNGYEVEEYLHGPAFEVKKDHALFFLDGDETMHDRIVSIYEASHELTDRVYLITHRAMSGDTILSIDTECDPVFRTILYVALFQYIPGKMCEELNIRSITIYNHRASCKVVTKTDK